MDQIDIVCGRALVREPTESIRRRAAQAAYVHIDIGTGDGKFLYRRARSHPEGLFIGVDANAQRMRQASFRASRKPARGGAANARYVRSSLAELPGALAGLADVVTVLYPWGSLLDAVLQADARLIALGKPGARLEAVLNGSALDGRHFDEDDLRTGYARVGMVLESLRRAADPPETSWAASLRPADAWRIVGYRVARSLRPSRRWVWSTGGGAR